MNDVADLCCVLCVFSKPCLVNTSAFTENMEIFEKRKKRKPIGKLVENESNIGNGKRNANNEG